MPRASRACPHPRCPNILPCPEHSPDPGPDNGKPLIALLGPPASGKSTLGPPLAAALGLQLLTIDDYRRAGPADGWTRLVRDAMAGGCITESCLMPAPYRRLLLARHRAVVIHLACDERVRRARIAARQSTRPDDDLRVPAPNDVPCLRLDSSETPVADLLDMALRALKDMDIPSKV